jgi:hypothetical protein
MIQYGGIFQLPSWNWFILGNMGDSLSTCEMRNWSAWSVKDMCRDSLELSVVGRDELYKFEDDWFWEREIIRSKFISILFTDCSFDEFDKDTVSSCDSDEFSWLAKYPSIAHYKKNFQHLLKSFRIENLHTSRFHS